MKNTTFLSTASSSEALITSVTDSFQEAYDWAVPVSISVMALLLAVGVISYIFNRQ